MTASAEVSRPLTMSYSGWKMPVRFEMGKHRQMARDFIQGDAKLYALWGSVSSGKTVTSSQAWAAMVERCPMHYPLAMIGKTERTLEANVLDPLAEFLGSKYSENRGRGIVYLYDRKIRIYGANDSKSESKIRGKTLYAWYGDEVTTWPESFFMMALSRLRIPGAKAIMTMNPEGPYHWYHKQVIDRADDPNIRAKLYHFTMADNPHLSEEYKSWIASMYTPGTVWYKRWIEGKWAAAEGAIYDPDIIARATVNELPGSFDRYHVGIDYAESSVNVMLLLGRNNGTWYLIREIYHDAVKAGRQKLNSEYSKDCGELLKDGHPRIDCDPGGGGAGLITQIRHDHPGFVVNPALNAVVPGIQTVAGAMARGQLKIYANCKHTLEEMSNYVWDPKAQERGEDKPLKQNDHCCDALRYAVYRVLKGTASVGAKPRGM